MTIDRKSPLAQAYLWARQHNTTNQPASRDIARARIDVAEGKTRYARGADYKPGGNWQPSDSMPRYTSASSRAYYCDTFDDYRVAGRADEVLRSIRHSGWYTDDDGDSGTLAGYVVRLPHGRLIPATRHSEWCGVTLYPLDSYDDPEECARAADSYAEQAADSERDYNRAWQAGSRAAELARDAIAGRREILAICRDLRVAKLAASSAEYVARPVGATGIQWVDTRESVARLCGIARNKVARLLREVHGARTKRDSLRDDYGSQQAFADGFEG